MSHQADEVTSPTSASEIEFDENDNKIIQLYEVINELIDDQKARIEDMELLYHDKGEIVLQNVEHRNNSTLNQIYSELQLKEEDDSDSDESEDEQDQGWEIYNGIVSNLNNYMAQIALFSQKLKESRELIEESTEDEVKELEVVVEAQTHALEQQMKRNEDLEKALSSVLNEYTNRLNTGNNEISSLHKQLSYTNKQHSKQIAELKEMYEKKIRQLQQSQDNQYKEEVSKLIDSLSSSRNDFQKQIVALTQEMSDAQTEHHTRMIDLTQYNQTLTNALAEKTLLVEDLKQKQFNLPNKVKLSLRKRRGTLEIDDEEEFFYNSYKNGGVGVGNIDANKHMNVYNNGGKKKRTFTPSGYTNNKQNGHGSSASQTALQAKYSQYKNKNNQSNKPYQSRSGKSKYSQRGY